MIKGYGGLFIPVAFNHKTLLSYSNHHNPKSLKGLQKIKKISTHLLTVLIISVILQLEQRKRNKRNTKSSGSFPNPEVLLLTTLEMTSRVLMAAAKAAHIKFVSDVSIRKGEMTYVNA